MRDWYVEQNQMIDVRFLASRLIFPTYAQLEGGPAYHSSHAAMVPVLNLSLMVHLSQHGGVSLQHVRRLTDLLHQSMSHVMCHV